MKKLYTLFGIIAPLIYFLAVIIGGALRSDYSHIYNTVSELTMANAPNVALMDIMFGAYNLALLIFGIGAFLDQEIDQSKKYRLATIMLVFIGLLGLLLLVFTQDPRGAASTLSGTIHIVLAGIVSLLTLLSIMLVALSFKINKQMKSFVIYSYASFTVVLISGVLSAITIANNGNYGGLLERITIGTFLLWILVFSYMIRKIPDRQYN